ncbi:MAG: DUF11 domain-containing protein [Chloroflexi bacterium]|nr:MAG: hypothetical protein CUN54_03100 [Phototrophicales bacterium]RMF80077.1 MAG: DUF11 domain-containing protein [Chloroflexota bacterium]
MKLQRLHKWFIIGTLCMIFVTTGIAQAQDDINLDLGTIPAGQQIRIEFDVVINDNLPDNVTQIENQGIVTTDNLGTTLTDDPDTSQPNDVTITPLNILLINPFISKQADPPFALPGEDVTFAFTVSNPNPFDVTNIIATDNVPASLQVLNASAPSGNVTVNGQTVTFTQASLASGASVTITVNTRVSDDIEPPFILINEVCGNYEGAAEVCATATVTSVSALPATGETPFWRTPLLIVLVITAGIILVSTATFIARHRTR